LEGVFVCEPVFSVGVLIMDGATPTLSILDLVMERMASGVLWIVKAEPVWMGRGTFKPCVVCRVRIHGHETQVDVPGPRGALPAHATCYEIWRKQSDKQQKEQPG
jgi:hypothetical protein